MGRSCTGTQDTKENSAVARAMTEMHTRVENTNRIRVSLTAMLLLLLRKGIGLIHRGTLCLKSSDREVADA